MTSVKYILRAKGGTALSVVPSVSVYEAVQAMIDNNVGSLLVVQDGKLIGLFTERDFMRNIALKGKSALDGVVEDMMVREIQAVSPTTTIEQCMALMTDKRTRHLPVLENEELVGIVSIGDVVKKLIEEKDFVIEQMEKYITGC
jgi:CBS domain-containing protein